ncbi:unnamed protein product, partial [Adineta steineri]
SRSFNTPTQISIDNIYAALRTIDLAGLEENTNEHGIQSTPMKERSSASIPYASSPNLHGYSSNSYGSLSRHTSLQTSTRGRSKSIDNVLHNQSDVIPACFLTPNPSSPNFASRFRADVRTLYGRHLPQPRFLTVQDFADGSLKHKGLTDEPVVYAVTICIPRRIYNCMKKDPKLRKRKVVQTAWIDHMKFAHLRGKIGETCNFTQRVEGYNYTGKGGQLGPIFCYLRQKARESTTGHFTDWVKVWPILSGEDMKYLDKRIQMETLCSFLLGRAGNSGYNHVGRCGNRTLEQMLASVKHLHKRMATPIIGKDGLPTTLREITNAKTKKTMSATTIGPDGEPISGYKRSRKAHYLC